MIFRSRKSPPSHFRRYYNEKESWSAVKDRLRNRPPESASLSFWREILKLETDSALKITSCLLAVQLFESLVRDGSLQPSDIDEEIVIHECLMFSSSLLAFHLEDFFIFLEQRKEPPMEVSSFGDDLCITFERMSLLIYDEIEEAEMERIPLYQECYETRDWRRCLSRTGARVLTRLVAGEHFTQIKLRTEDPVDLRFEMSMTGFIADSNEHLDVIGALLEKQVDDALVASMTLRG